MRRNNAGIPSATLELYAPGLQGGQQQQRMGSSSSSSDTKPQKARSFFFADDEPAPGFAQADSSGFAWMAEGDNGEDELPDDPGPASAEARPLPSRGAQARPARSAGRRRSDRSSGASRAHSRPQSAPMLASVSSSFASGVSGASPFSQQPAAIVEVASTVSQREAPPKLPLTDASMSQREAVRAGTQRLAMHRLKKQQTEKRRVQDLQDYARAQRRQLVASIRLANDCCRILKRPVTYGISDDPTKKGLFDLETPSTLQMRVIVRQQGPSQYGWKSQGEAHYREISVPLFQKELDGLQREAAVEEQRRREASLQGANPEQQSAAG
jgi:hypothetical protein